MKSFDCIQKAYTTNFLFHHVDSVKCDLLFELAHNATREEKDAVEVKCYHCKRLVGYLNYQKKRTSQKPQQEKLRDSTPLPKLD